MGEIQLDEQSVIEQMRALIETDEFLEAHQMFDHDGAPLRAPHYLALGERRRLLQDLATLCFGDSEASGYDAAVGRVYGDVVHPPWLKPHAAVIVEALTVALGNTEPENAKNILVAIREGLMCVEDARFGTQGAGARCAEVVSQVRDRIEEYSRADDADLANLADSCLLALDDSAASG